MVIGNQQRPGLVRLLQERPRPKISTERVRAKEARLMNGEVQ